MWLFFFKRSQLLERCRLHIAEGELKLISSVYVKLAFFTIITIYYSFLLFFYKRQKKKPKYLFYQKKRNSHFYTSGASSSSFGFLRKWIKSIGRKSPKKTAQGGGKETPKPIILRSTEVINYNLGNVKQWYSPTQRYCWSSPQLPFTITN